MQDKTKMMRGGAVLKDKPKMMRGGAVLGDKPKMMRGGLVKGKAAAAKKTATKKKGKK